MQVVVHWWLQEVNWSLSEVVKELVSAILVSLKRALIVIKVVPTVFADERSIVSELEGLKI